MPVDNLKTIQGSSCMTSSSCSPVNLTFLPHDEFPHSKGNKSSKENITA